MDCSHAGWHSADLRGDSFYCRVSAVFPNESARFHVKSREIIPSHFEIDRGSIEKTAIFSRLKAERCNCRFRHDRSPMILFVSLVNLCLHWLNVWLTACAEFLAERERDNDFSLDPDSNITIRTIEVQCKRYSIRFLWILSMDFLNND